MDDNSKIITISFGETRFMEFKNIETGSIFNQKLVHGDVMIMEKASQSLFTHSIPKDCDNSLKTRISVMVGVPYKRC